MKETIEEAAERNSIGIREENYKDGFIDGAKWMQDKNKYSEEDIKKAFFSGCLSETQIKPRIKCWEEWFEQFKKK